MWCEHIRLNFSSDGDLITVMDSSDLNVAKQISRLLKITIFSKDCDCVVFLCCEIGSLACDLMSASIFCSE